MCQVMGIARSGYYAWKSRILRDTKAEELKMVIKIKEIFNRFRKVYGTRKIVKELKRQGIIVNRKKVQRIMRETNIVPITVLMSSEKPATIPI